MFRRCQAWLIVSLLTLSLGGHWALLQSVAWTSMLVRYSQDRPLSEAVSMTFDGEHPCRLCHAVQQGREEERRQERNTPSNAKLELGLPNHRLRLPLPVPSQPTFPAPFASSARTAEPPPKPPPRPA